jgi:hypothetical protein
MKNYLLGLLMLPLIFNIIVPDAQAGSLSKRISGVGVYRGSSGSGSPVQDTPVKETQPEVMISEEGTKEDFQYAEKEVFQYAEKEVAAEYMEVDAGVSIVKETQPEVMISEEGTKEVFQYAEKEVAAEYMKVDAGVSIKLEAREVVDLVE